MARSQSNLYSLILGLPDDVENPDHYQILGLPRFTTDVKAIREAAISQNSKLLKWQNSEHFKDSLRLTQQIVEAKQVLENPQTKRAYDQELQRAEASKVADNSGTLDLGTQETVETRRVPPPPPRVVPVSRKRPQVPRRTKKTPRRSKRVNSYLTPAVVFIMGCLGAAVVLGIVLYRISRPDPLPMQADQSKDEEGPIAAPSDPPELLKAPFDENQAQRTQSEWAKFLRKDVGEINSIGMELVLIPPGEFTMGSPGKSAVIFWDEMDEHRVVINQPFSMSRTEVTQGQWEKVMGTTPWRFQRYVQEGPDFPAAVVNWPDAAAFCKKLTEQERQAGMISDNEEYTLPTEAEWEYACRAGTTTKYSFGDEESELSDAGWHSQVSWSTNERYPHRVGRRIPNSFGLHDMHGNVSEWCSDWYDADYYDKSPRENPPGPTLTKLDMSRVHRGGGWSSPYSDCRSAARDKANPETAKDDLGFRVVLRLQPSS